MGGIGGKKKERKKERERKKKTCLSQSYMIWTVPSMRLGAASPCQTLVVQMMQQERMVNKVDDDSWKSFELTGKGSLDGKLRETL